MKNKSSSILIFFVPIFLAGCGVAKFKTLSKPEKNWVITHPFSVKKAMKISNIAIFITDSIKKSGILDQEISGGKLDAFRHSFWMASLSQKIGPKKSLKLGIAHEKGNKEDYEKRKLEEGQLPDSLSSVMDLFNNTVGIRIGCENQRTSREALVNLIIEYIHKGELRIIAKNKEGKFVDCNGNVLNESDLKGKWKNNKCLVRSDYTIR